MVQTRYRRLSEIAEGLDMADSRRTGQNGSTSRTSGRPRTRSASRAAESSRATSAFRARSTSRSARSPSPEQSHAPNPSRQQEEVRNAPSMNQEATNPSGNEGQMAGLVQALTGFLQHVQQVGQQGSRSDPPSRVGRGIAEFKKLAPPVFEGSTDPTESLKWLKEMEKAFDSMECTDREKVRYAAYQLQGEAYEWWEAVKRQRGDDRSISWDGFRQEFLDMYFPESLRFEKESEFTRLYQGNMTVAQYEAKFIELSRFAPDLIATDNIKARRFEKGLRPRIRAGVRPMRLDSYREVVNLAKIVEQEAENMQQERERQQKKRASYDGSQGGQFSGNKSRKRENQKKSNNAHEKNGPRCSRCRGFHLVQDCRWFSGACFECGQQGHKAVNCPHRQNSGYRQPSQNAYGPPQVYPAPGPSTTQGQPSGYGGQQKQKTQARVFAMTHQDAQASNAIVTGT